MKMRTLNASFNPNATIIATHVWLDDILDDDILIKKDENITWNKPTICVKL